MIRRGKKLAGGGGREVLGEGHGKVLVGWCWHKLPSASFIPITHAGHAHLEQVQNEIRVGHLGMGQIQTWPDIKVT